MGQLERIPPAAPTTPIQVARIFTAAAGDRQRRDRHAPEDKEPKDVIDLAGLSAPPQTEPPAHEADPEAPEVEPGGLDLSA
jgi:hypothetical protein